MVPSAPCEQLPELPEFRRLESIAGISVDLRYAGPHNFVGRNLYGTLDCRWLHHLAAEGLERAVQWLREQAPQHRLLVLDAMRPHRVQIVLWDHLAGTDLRQYVADPARGSIHSFGMAVDVTLVDAQGREQDMGAGFDEMTPLSHPVLEAQFLAEGRLTPAQLERRRILRAAMAAGGFGGVDNEWWHFDMLDRTHVRQTFRRID
jgi:zinc D-Ala-D-Ala dipeptidase